MDGCRGARALRAVSHHGKPLRSGKSGGRRERSESLREPFLPSQPLLPSQVVRWFARGLGFPSGGQLHRRCGVAADGENDAPKIVPPVRTGIRQVHRRTFAADEPLQPDPMGREDLCALSQHGGLRAPAQGCRHLAAHRVLEPPPLPGEQIARALRPGAASSRRRRGRTSTIHPVASSRCSHRPHTP